MSSKTTYLHSSFLHGEGASNFSSTTTIYDPVIFDEVSDDTESIVYRALGFINDLGDGQSRLYLPYSKSPTNHLVASSYENRNGTAVGTLFNDKHLLPGGTECHLPHPTCGSQFLWAQVLETRDNSSIRSNGNEFNFGTTDPPDGRKLVLE
jgi:hypothetical protein